MARIVANMARRQAYTVIYARGVMKHLNSIDAKYDSLIREKTNVETKNRKPLRQPAPLGAEWEVRFGPDNRFRVLYDINQEQHTVQIVAIGEKKGNRLIVGGEEVGL